MKIAIIDDDIVFLERLQNILTKELLNYKILNYEITSYQNSEDLFLLIDQFDVIFIDVEINLENGIEISEKIRKLNSYITIIFISSYETYVFHSFAIHPFSYILKSKLETDGIMEIDRYIEYYINENLSFIIESFGISYTLNQRKIKKISKSGNKCEFYYSGKIFKSIININKVLSLLAPYFIQINKSEIINFHYVIDITKDVITLNDNKKYYVSRRRIKKVNDAWVHYLKTKG